MRDPKGFSERRANSRMQSRIPVSFSRVEDPKLVEDLKGKAGQAQDLSLDGIYIKTDKAKVGDVVRIDIPVPDKKGSLFAFAEVVRVDETGAGLRLMLMEDEDRQSLRDFLESSKTG